MKTRVIYAILAVIVLAIVAFALFYNKQEDDSQQAGSSNATQNQQTEAQTNSNTAPVVENTNTQSAVTNTNTTKDTSADKGTYSDESDIDAPDVAVHEISFSGTAYSPKTLTIKQGDIVVFKNNSTKDFWPASADHPTHTKYPEFDAKGGIAAGKTFQFKFAKKGTWSFHDHLTPSATGVITVE